MADTNCIQYRIAEDLVTALKLIKVTGGYKYTIPDASCMLAAAIPENPDPTKPAAYVDIMGGTPIEDQGHTIIWDYQFVVTFTNVHSGENPNINTDNANAIADITKALKYDVYRGGLAQYTEFGECGNAWDPHTGLFFVFVDVKCLTSVRANDPYTAAK
jgi:hypothetical protein